MVLKYEKEAKDILRILDQYVPKILDGVDCINWLHKYSTQKKQDEWAGFFFEDFSFSILKHILGGTKGPRIIPGKRFDYQLEFVWDFKLEAENGSNGKKTKEIILNDITATNRVLEFEDGIGYIIAKAKFQYDNNGKLRRWRDKKENRKRQHTKSRVLKRRGTITDVFAVFIKNKDELDKAIKSGWISIFNQGENVGGASRKPKYQIKLDKIPKKYLIQIENS